MDISLLKDFEELEGLNEDENLETQNDQEDEDDPSFKPINAATLQPGDVRYELEKRGLQPSGFANTDAEMLQKEFDKEFSANLEEARIKRREAKRRAALQAGLQKRREKMESTLQEEQDELASNRPVAMVIEMVKENMTDKSLRLDVNSVAARVLSKAMWANNTITCIDLSSSALSDHAGSYLARILKRNSTLKKMELDSNQLGVKTCIAFGESLRVNTSLVYLSLDSNPLCGLLTDEGFGDSSGIQALADSLSENTTLTSLNLFRTGITQNGGVALAQGIAGKGNNTLLFCEVGHNLIAMAEVKQIADKLDANLAAYEARERQRRQDLISDEERQAQRDREASEESKRQELAEWLRSRREQRAESRRLEEEEKILQVQAAAEEAARVAAQERKAAAEKAAEAAASKGKAKKK